MFTGIIQTLGMVKSARHTGPTMQLAVDIGPLAAASRPSDSIAVNGACLTVSRLDGSVALFDISAETLEKTTLGKLPVGSKVNLEPALTPTDRFGGHFVLGHIDGVAKIKDIRRQGQFADFTFTAEKNLLDLMVPKGSVAIDGISLTIARLNPDSFSVAIIPQTLEKTNLAHAKPGDSANIEIDLIVKTIKRLLHSLLPNDNLTIERLKQIGY